LSGEIAQVIYIGTDTRYLVTLLSGESIAVRVQNSSGRYLEQYKRGDPVKIYWNPEDARTLVI
jgi:spermidine/putrescine transport system ATP-binding protein